MNSDNPIILLLEDCTVSARIVERTLMNEIPRARVLWARNVQDATERAEGLAIDLFLLDIELPDGNGLDFLWKVAADHPLARAIVMTANPLPEHQMNSAALGVLHFLEKPLKHSMLVELVRQALETEQMAGVHQDFRATLANVTPVDIIQLKCLTNATTVMEFRSHQNVGWIRFERGEIADAETGALRGEDAIFDIIAWKHGEVSEQPHFGGSERTIHASWQGLLMDAAQRLDEAAAAA